MNTAVPVTDVPSPVNNSSLPREIYASRGILLLLLLLEEEEEEESSTSACIYVYMVLITITRGSHKRVTLVTIEYTD